MPISDADTKPPKLFVSYSWTSEDHKQWVLELATELRESGVEVILDRWHLLEGQDTHVFMERMVSDPEIKHVALICDRKYVEKANTRDGGVGTEAQIITPSIYTSHQQTKFVAVVVELNEEGKPHVPIYYGAKKWIGFLDPSTYSDDFERLLRWALDLPLDKPPPVGKRPGFLSVDERTIELATTSLQRRAVDAMKGAKSNALAALTDYLERVVSEFEKLRIWRDPKDDTPFDEHMITSIEGFLPYRNELITGFVTASIYANHLPVWESLQRFFERLIPFQERPGHLNYWGETDFENFSFLIHELFLYLIATFLKYEKFDAVEYFLSARYYVGRSIRFPQERMRSYKIFLAYSKLLDFRKRRLKLSLWNLQSQLLKDRSVGQPVEFEHIMTADVILWFRDRVSHHDWSCWFPLTFVFIDRFNLTLELFVRAESARHLSKVLPLLGVDDVVTLKAKAQEIDNDPHRPRAGFDSLSASNVLGIGKIGTVP